MTTKFKIIFINWLLFHWIDYENGAHEAIRGSRSIQEI
jgi:hypothetical protein